MNRWSLLALLAWLLVGCGGDEQAATPDEEQVPFPDPGPSPINDATQVVMLEFTAEYQQALTTFGLTAADAALRRAIRTALQQILADFNFSVLTDAGELNLANPLQIATIEIRNISADSPTIMALDNSSADKDVGNTVRNERAGGVTESGHGGVFVGAFVTLSLALEQQKPEEERSGIADSQFDDLFWTFMPALGGTPLATYPASRDDAAAGVAISTLAALVSTTAVTVIGHLVGLPAGLPDHSFWYYDDAGCYMDTGSDRTFAERAQLSAAPLHFCPDNVTYLQTILPK